MLNVVDLQRKRFMDERLSEGDLFSTGMGHVNLWIATGQGGAGSCLGQLETDLIGISFAPYLISTLDGFRLCVAKPAVTGWVRLLRNCTISYK